MKRAQELHPCWYDSFVKSIKIVSRDPSAATLTVPAAVTAYGATAAHGHHSAAASTPALRTEFAAATSAVGADSAEVKARALWALVDTVIPPIATAPLPLQQQQQQQQSPRFSPDARPGSGQTGAFSAHAASPQWLCVDLVKSLSVQARALMTTGYATPVYFDASMDHIEHAGVGREFPTVPAGMVLTHTLPSDSRTAASSNCSNANADNTDTSSRPSPMLPIVSYPPSQPTISTHPAFAATTMPLSPSHCLDLSLLALRTLDLLAPHTAAAAAFPDTLRRVERELTAAHGHFTVPHLIKKTAADLGSTGRMNADAAHSHELIGEAAALLRLLLTVGNIIEPAQNHSVNISQNQSITSDTSCDQTTLSQFACDFGLGAEGNSAMQRVLLTVSALVADLEHSPLTLPLPPSPNAGANANTSYDTGMQSQQHQQQVQTLLLSRPDSPLPPSVRLSAASAVAAALFPMRSQSPYLVAPQHSHAATVAAAAINAAAALESNTRSANGAVSLLPSAALTPVPLSPPVAAALAQLFAAAAGVRVRAVATASGTPLLLYRPPPLEAAAATAADLVRNRTDSGETSVGAVNEREEVEDGGQLCRGEMAARLQGGLLLRHSVRVRALSATVANHKQHNDDTSFKTNTAARGDVDAAVVDSMTSAVSAKELAAKLLQQRFPHLSNSGKVNIPLPEEIKNSNSSSDAQSDVANIIDSATPVQALPQPSSGLSLINGLTSSLDPLLFDTTGALPVLLTLSPPPTATSLYSSNTNAGAGSLGGAAGSGAGGAPPVLTVAAVTVGSASEKRLYERPTGPRSGGLGWWVPPSVQSPEQSLTVTAPTRSEQLTVSSVNNSVNASTNTCVNTSATSASAALTVRLAPHNHRSSDPLFAPFGGIAVPSTASSHMNESNSVSHGASIANNNTALVFTHDSPAGVNTPLIAVPGAAVPMLPLSSPRQQALRVAQLALACERVIRLPMRRQAVTRAAFALHCMSEMSVNRSNGAMTARDTSDSSALSARGASGSVDSFTTEWAPSAAVRAVASAAALSPQGLLWGPASAAEAEWQCIFARKK